MKLLEGNVVGTGLKVGIVAARFNEFIVSKLVSGAQDALFVTAYLRTTSKSLGFRAHLKSR